MDDLIPWLTRGDPSIAYLAKTGLLGQDASSDKARIGKYGWCADYLGKRNPEGGWGRGFYQPKWTSTHYTLLELRNLRHPKNDSSVRAEAEKILAENRGDDGGINPAKTIAASDVCVSGMFLDYASYFGVAETKLRSLIDYILGQGLPDGGYNCDLARYGAVHSSMHSTLSVLEGFRAYLAEGHSYRKGDIEDSMRRGGEFLLAHRLFKSSRTGEIIDRKFLRMTYPFRWKYTIVRAMGYFADAGWPYDERMKDAIRHIAGKRGPDGAWKLQSRFPGKEYFEMEATGEPSRMMTYLCLRIIAKYPIPGPPP